MPQTSLGMTSNHFVARLPKLEKDRVLLLPNLKVKPSMEAIDNSFWFPNKPDLINETTQQNLDVLDAYVKSQSY